MRRFARGGAAAALTVLLAGGLVACGGDDEKGSSSDPVVVDITFEGDTVTPAGERVEAAVGQPIDLKVTADAPGEIHVHSDPEQELEYDAGEMTFEIEIDRPGLITVESHTLDKVIVQLEVK